MASEQQNFKKSDQSKSTSSPPIPSAPTSQSDNSTSTGTWWSRLPKTQRENAQILVVALVLALIGDRLVVEKVSYYLHPPSTGDIVVFEPPPQLLEYGYAPGKAFIKRVIGTPGDVVQISGGSVYLNGQVLVEEYIAEAPAYELPPLRVPNDQLFVMGDNRNNSNDSHIWGFLPQQNVIGRAVFRFFPIDRIGWIMDRSNDSNKSLFK
jgi:signal peptidase I